VVGAVFLLSQRFDPPYLRKQLADLLLDVVAVLLSHKLTSVWNTDKYAEVRIPLAVDREAIQNLIPELRRCHGGLSVVAKALHLTGEQDVKENSTLDRDRVVLSCGFGFSSIFVGYEPRL
jgi:hypothetical protein